MHVSAQAAVRLLSFGVACARASCGAAKSSDICHSRSQLLLLATGLENGFCHGWILPRPVARASDIAGRCMRRLIMRMCVTTSARHRV